MKKFILAAAVLLLMGISLGAQPRSFGLRFGAGLEISYQHNLGNTAQGPNFLEFDAGVMGYTNYPGYRITAAYDFTILHFGLLGGDFNMFIGPGVTVGMYDKSKFMGGLVAQFGVSYDFSFPLSIGIDTRPCFILSGDGASVAFKEMIPMVSLRWKF